MKLLWKYWDKRYDNKVDTFEWAASWDAVRQDIFQHAIGSQNLSTIKVLNVGCGNSTLPEEMYDEGILHIFNIDISQVCLD